PQGGTVVYRAGAQPALVAATDGGRAAWPRAHDARVGGGLHRAAEQLGKRPQLYATVDGPAALESGPLRPAGGAGTRRAVDDRSRVACDVELGCGLENARAGTGADRRILPSRPPPPPHRQSAGPGRAPPRARRTRGVVPAR